MTCEDCLKKELGYCKLNCTEPQRCEDFKDKSEWFHLSGKDCETAYYAVGYGNDARVIEEPICGWGIKNRKRCVIDECGDFYEIGKLVFLTKENAEKEVEWRKNR